MVGGFNVVLILWGVLLKIRSRKYWYRNYHIGKTLMLALIPILASCYVSFSEMPESQVVKKNKFVRLKSPSIEQKTPKRGVN